MNTFPETLNLKSDMNEILLGYYDFDRFSVILGSHDDPDIIPITLLHEANHQRLNISSTFGLLLNKVAGQVRAKKDLSISAELEKLLQLLLSKCTLVHEMVATYTSLVTYKREHLVTKMPSEYQTCFDLMNSMMQNAPATKLWRTSIAWHLARSAMLVKPYNKSADLKIKDIRKITANICGSELQSPNSRMKLLHDAMQKFDFDKFQTHMEKFGGTEDFIMAFLESDNPREISGALGRSTEDWGSIYNWFDSLIMYSLIDMFDELLPGLEDARQHMSLIRLGKLANAMDRRQNMTTSQLPNEQYGLEARELLIDFCHQRITFFDPGSISAEILKLQGAFLSYINLRSYNLLQTSFLLYLLKYDKKAGFAETEIHVTDFGGNHKVPHIVIEGKEAVGLFALTEPMISIIEIDASDEIWEKSFFEKIGETDFLGKAFLHSVMNPILMIERLLYTGCVIEWSPCAVGYQQGPIGTETEMQVCLYWIDKCPIPVFHLSNTAMSDALFAFSDEFIADTIRFRNIDAEAVLKRITREDFSRLLDHPVFNYYLSGSTAQIEVAKAGKR